MRTQPARLVVVGWCTPERSRCPDSLDLEPTRA